MVAHTQEVLETLASTLALITDAESAQRGYIITGSVEYLEPYHGALPQVHASVRRLQGLVQDNPQQTQAAARLAQLVPERLAIMHRVVQLRTDGFEAARRQVAGNEGRRLTDQIRMLVDDMMNRERALLEARAAVAREAVARTLWVGTGGMSLALLLFMALLSAIRAEHEHRAAAEAKLQATNAGLAESLERLERVGREQAALSSMADLLQSCRTIDEARPVIVNALRQLFPDDAAAVCLVNSSQNLMEVLLEAAPAGEASGTEGVFAPEQCWALRRGRPHVVDAQGVTAGQACPHVQKGAAPAGHACLPMMAQGETVGTLFLRPRGGAPDEAKQALVRTTSEQLGMALANLKLQETLRLQSIRDPLTGLFNRRYLEASLEREFARARRGQHPVAVLMMDVDHFKRFNDTFGHEAGDVVLAEVGAVLRSCSREDDIACRYGGEEFSLILPETTVEQAVQRAEEVRDRTRRLRLEHRRKSLGTITVSIGVAAYPRDGEAGDSVINAADAALYRAKQEGRDRVAVADELPPQGHS